jgi:hypothetical protein
LPNKKHLEFFLLRYVPNIVREEFINFGFVAIDSESPAVVRLVKEWQPIRCLDPQVDTEYLEAIGRDLQSLLNTDDRELKLKRLRESLSNSIQISETASYETENFAAEITKLTTMYLDRAAIESTRRATSGRMVILNGMTDAWAHAGIAGLVARNIAAEPYTKPGDPFKFDFGYRIDNTMHLFQAVSLKPGIDAAVLLAARYPKVALGMTRVNKLTSHITAVIDDDLDTQPELITFALQAMQDEKIRIAPLSQMPQIAETARLELRA